MFLNNFKNFMLRSQNGTRGTNTGIVSTAGNINPYTTDDSGTANSGYKTLFEQTTIIIGTGTAEPTLTDYRLGNDCTMSTNSSVTKTLFENDGTITARYTLSGRNTSGKTLKISEVAWQKKISSYTSYGTQAILTRSLLPQPIEVANNQNFVIEYEVQI